jgi:hypothetical protein
MIYPVQSCGKTFTIIGREPTDPSRLGARDQRLPPSALTPTEFDFAAFELKMAEHYAKYGRIIDETYIIQPFKRFRKP